MVSGKMKGCSRWLVAMGTVVAIATSASAQNMNIDFSTLLGTPSASYGAGSGQAGIWANVNGAITTPQALVDTLGSPVAATLTITTGNFDFSFNNVGTTGDDEALMDDGVDMGGTGATDTITISNLNAGTYAVYTYAWAPDNAAYVTSVNVDGLGAQNVGGAWPGAQTQGITYSLHDNIVVPAGGTITIVTATVTTFSTLNGIQLVAGAPDQGRCCDQGGSCSITLEIDCVAPSVFAGVGTNCANDPCRGRCCDTISGTCELTGPADCVAPGAFGGLGTNCNNSPCTGRCCDVGGNCTLTGPAGCAGVYGGLGTNCDSFLTYGNPSPIPVTMPPAGAAPPSIITVADSFVITDVDVLVKVQHTWRNDAILQLQGPDGTLVPLTGTAAGICGGEDNINAIFDDEGSAVVCASANLANLNATPDRIFTNPVGGLAAFDGLNAAGDWTLLASDIVTADSGAVQDWSLIFAGSSPCSSEACTCFGDLTGDGMVNGRDVNAMAACVISAGGAGCDCADVDHAGGVTAADVGPFITALLNGACAP